MRSLSTTTYVFADSAELLQARDAWCADPAAARNTYGEIGGWNVEAVTDLSGLFCADVNPPWPDEGAIGCNPACVSFNGDVGNWNVGSVTNTQSARHARRLGECVRG